MAKLLSLLRKVDHEAKIEESLQDLRLDPPHEEPSSPLPAPIGTLQTHVNAVTKQLHIMQTRDEQLTRDIDRMTAEREENRKVQQGLEMALLYWNKHDKHDKQSVQSTQAND